MFYTYKQNLAHDFYAGRSIIIIEADSAKEDNKLAKKKNPIYFDGVQKRIDCDCCGDRWVRCKESDGTLQPCIDGENDLKVYLDEYSYFDNVTIYKKDGTCIKIGSFISDLII